MWSFTWPSETIFSEMLSKVKNFAFKWMHFKIPSAKCRPFCSGFPVFVLWRKRGFNCDERLGSNGCRTRPMATIAQIIGIQGLISEFKFKGNSACLPPNYIKVIAITFCIYHGDCIVVIYARFGSHCINEDVIKLILNSAEFELRVKYC